MLTPHRRPSSNREDHCHTLSSGESRVCHGDVHIVYRLVYNQYATRTHTHTCSSKLCMRLWVYACTAVLYIGVCVFVLPYRLCRRTLTASPLQQQRCTLLLMHPSSSTPCPRLYLRSSHFARPPPHNLQTAKCCFLCVRPGPASLSR